MNLELPLGPLTTERPHPVAAVLAAAREAIEAVFRNLWVEGELTEVRPWKDTGIWYVTLAGAEKDVLRGVVFRFEARRLGRMLKELKPGTQVYVRGDLTVDRKKGELQLMVRDILPRPEGGMLQLQYERAHAALAKDGLLDVTRKRALPRFPRRIAVVTSPEGAVWHDITTTIERRWPYLELVLVPSRVQGDGAAGSICRALTRAAALEAVDVVIVARGGGSKEDLACFNEEAVARAVAASPVPVISAVGHETDVTLTDLVADVRAPTPTAAAELAVPDKGAIAADVARLEQALGKAVTRTIESAGHRVARTAHRVDAAVARRVHRAAQRAESAALMMGSSIDAMLARRRAGLEQSAASLQALSPLTLLGRGYSVARDGSGRVLRKLVDFPPGSSFGLRVTDGEVAARVREA